MTGVISDPSFWWVALPAVLLLGLSKSGFASGLGSLATPLLAVAMPVPQAAAVMLPLLAPFRQGLREQLAGQPAQREAASSLNSALQIGYFILAVRSLGLDAGPMGGFDAAGVDAEFFAGTGLKSMVVCNIGHGDPAALRPRAPRLDFDTACAIL